jgi:cytochrome P450
MVAAQVQQLVSGVARVPHTDIRHIPGDPGYPVFGNTFEVLSDSYDFARRMRRKHGLVFKVNFLFREFVWLLGPEATEYVLMDPDRIFSNMLGWGSRLGGLFTGGLMLRDFDDHRYHRKLMLGAFSNAALQSYVRIIEPAVVQAIDAVAEKESISGYGLVKDLSLRVALRAFLGNDLPEPQIAEINKAFVSVLRASYAFVRREVPGGVYARAMTARRFLAGVLLQLIEQRKAAPGPDLLSQLCLARDASGAAFSPKEIVDHMIFLLMAAHDTTASGLTTALYCLAKHPRWQSAAREECRAVEVDGKLEKLQELSLTESVIKESLRLYAPVGMFPRRTMAACSINGVDIPANTAINLSPGFNHYMEEYWTNPGEFDPERFQAHRSEHKKHAFQWIAFGGGAHKCVGMHFAYMESKLVLYHVLRRLSLRVPDGYEAKYTLAPMPKPRDGLPLLIRRAAGN